MGNISTESVLKSLKDSYLNREFEHSRDLLLKHKTYLPKGLFHYNLGTVYAKLEQPGAARFHFEKAIKEGHLTPNTFSNLLTVKKAIQIQDLEGSSHFLDSLHHNFYRFPTQSYEILSLTLISFVLVMTFFKKIKSKLILVMLFVMALSPIGLQHFYLKNQHEAIALKELNVYEGPSDIFERKFILNEGAKVIVGRPYNGWFQIKYPLHLSGWVQNNYLGILE